LDDTAIAIQSQAFGGPYLGRNTIAIQDEGAYNLLRHFSFPIKNAYLPSPRFGGIRSCAISGPQFFADPCVTEPIGASDEQPV
jgi:hypothetical protein